MSVETGLRPNVVRWRVTGYRDYFVPGDEQAHNYEGHVIVEDEQGNHYNTILTNVPDERYNELKTNYESWKDWQEGDLPVWMCE